ncbi:uncharacterized protein HMPREF1120_04577 [Exophiala dermatitidis NIH/UT8656]|uniref:Uncharacterized protein n=1 Tax=Exophiala dermatitidis (strain ATCC 34100 / CBS 525.76 / NIH/UT8656) TaxID=858893 RepID=H6C125_EXODN|nr:uncharacterized protein HMPREF1120_04577 [Exophiala dermatitidis NIH/UT8656]EHY56496.1 hypothetical protein HMPREF1120_04577 [Exophiala dermatitidis NIH/UT8656]
MHCTTRRVHHVVPPRKQNKKNPPPAEPNVTDTAFRFCRHVAAHQSFAGRTVQVRLNVGTNDMTVEQTHLQLGERADEGGGGSHVSPRSNSGCRLVRLRDPDSARGKEQRTSEVRLSIGRGCVGRKVQTRTEKY